MSAHDAAPREAAGLDLRIRAIRSTIVNVPLVAPYAWSAGLYPGQTRVLIEVETHEGIVGLGEAPHWRCAASIDELRPRLLGCDAYDLHSCWASAMPPIEASVLVEGADLVHAYGGIEMALWDVRAKAAGRPLYQLLGGAARTTVPFTEYFAARASSLGTGDERTPAQIAAYCARMVEEHGATGFEGKVGCSDLETDVATIREVRHAIGPERLVRLDANGGWRLDTARAALSRLADYDIANVEDPVGSFEDMAALRRHSSIPFSTHTPALRHALTLGVPDTFVLNVMVLGGLQRTLKFIAACEATGRGFWFHSGDTGVGVAAYLQLTAADPFLDRFSTVPASPCCAGTPTMSSKGGHSYKRMES